MPIVLRRSVGIGTLVLLLAAADIVGAEDVAQSEVAHTSPSTANADAVGSGAEPASNHRVGFGLQLGYGYGVAARSRLRGRDVADVRFIAVDPHVRIVLWSPGDGRHWYHGDLDGILEGTFLFQVAPHGGFAAGANALLRYRLLKNRSVRPFAEAGLGIGGLDFGLRSQDDGFSFFLQAGAGVRWQIDETWSLIGSVSWHHISNAQTHLPNNGIDDVLFVIGVEFW